LQSHSDQGTDKNRREELANHCLGNGQRAGKRVNSKNVTKAYSREGAETEISKLGRKLFDIRRG